MDFRLPEIGEGVYEAELVSWLVKPGDAVRRAQPLMEVLTDKATMEIPSPFSGTVTRLSAEPGQQIKVGDAVLMYEEAGKGSVEKEEVATTGAQKADGARRIGSGVTAVAATSNGPSLSDVKAAPSVRYMARKLGIDIGRVRGSGPDGRILIEDLSRHVQAIGREPATAVEEQRPSYGQPGTRIKLQGVRRFIAEHMVKAKKIIPHYTYVDECDVSELVRLREALREPFAQAGVKITYLPFFVKAVVAGLKEVPIVNASLDDDAGEIVVHDRYHVGIAVATPAGLFVPIVHDADKKGLLAIARDIERLTAEARAGKARLEDLRGGTFTVTSIGSLGGLFATPVIRHPEVGILGIGKIVKRPVFDDRGQVKPADMVYLSLSFDHRVLDGAVATAFGNVVMKHLQNPAAMLVAGS